MTKEESQKKIYLNENLVFYASSIILGGKNDQ